MASFEGSLRIPSGPDRGMRVHIDLTNERLRLTSGDTVIGDWRMGDVRVSALPDGFHLRAEGEDMVLDVTEDAEFAVALGLRSAPPWLARKMAMYLDGR